MNITEYTGNMRELMTWAMNRGEYTLESKKAMSSKYDRKTPPKEYHDFVKSLLPENCREVIGYWVGALDEDSQVPGEAWEIGYPHIHTESIGWPPQATTVITYLAVPEEGGEFAIGGYSPSEPYEFIVPRPRLTVVVDSTVWHGIRKIHKGVRVAMMATGMPT